MAEQVHLEQLSDRISVSVHEADDWLTVSVLERTAEHSWSNVLWSGGGSPTVEDAAAWGREHAQPFLAS